MRLIDADKLPINYDGHTISVWKNDIDEAPTINQWISVKDKLPEKAGEYLCYRRSLNDGYCGLLRYGVIYNKGRKRTFYFFDSEYGDVEVSNVTHWMKLPEPPRGNEE